MHRDPVCGKRMNANKAYARIKYGGEIYYLCCPLCQSQFERDPKIFVDQHRGDNKHEIRDKNRFR